jgi:hypothetical protein
MGKHLLTREGRIEKSGKWRKYMNRRHHVEDKIAARREELILQHMNIRDNQKKRGEPKNM